MSYTVPGLLNNPNAVAAKDLTDAILEIPSLLDWFQADPAHVTIASGKVSQLTGLKGARNLTQSNATYRSALVENGIGSGQTVLENGTTPFSYGLSGSNFPLSGAWTWALVVYEETGEDQAMINVFEDSVKQTGIYRTSGALRFHNKVGSSAGEIVIPDGFGQWRLIVVGATAAGVLKAEVNGVRLTDVTSDDAMANVQLAIGALGPSGGDFPFLGGYSDIWLFTDDLFVNQDQMELVRAFARETYGIGVA